MSSFGTKLRAGCLQYAACAIALSVCACGQSADLEKVLDRLDETAANFRTTEANFSWTQYNKVINDITDTQEGKIYFRRNGKDIQMAADIGKPDPKQVIFSEGKIQIYQPKIEQVDVYDAGTHREEFESFLVLGFGAGGHDMLKSFDVKYLGAENVEGGQTARLDLVPKSDKMKQHFSHITLWIDPQRGISIQQQLFETSGDYRLAKYSHIEVNQKISDNAFKLKISSRTKVINH
jgi:outer membrane lipoprotein-sorting protein